MASPQASSEETAVLGARLESVQLNTPDPLPPLSFQLGNNVTIQALDFSTLREALLEQHMPGTREWVFSAVYNWCNVPTETCQLFAVIGAGGTGKSVISAKLIEYLTAHSISVGAVHFMRHDNPTASAPISLLCSLSAQLAGKFPSFLSALSRSSAAISSALANTDVESLFELLLASPLRTLLPTPPPVVIVVDALDELPTDALKPVLSLLSTSFLQLPSFVRLFVTSREQADVKQSLSKFSPLELLVDELRNRQDIRAFLAHVASLHVKLTLSMSDVESRVMARWPGFDVAGKLAALQAPLSLSKMCYDVAADTISREAWYGELCDIPEVRPFPPPSQQLGAGTEVGRELSSIFKDAGEARIILRSALADEWTPAGARIEVPVRGKSKSWVDGATDPNLKGEVRARQKAANDYNGDVLQLKDIARVSLEYTSCHRMYQGFLELKKIPGLKVISLKNKYANPTPMGYRDFNLGVEVTLADGRRHICEIQMNLVDMLTAKHGAHKQYEIVRTELPKICALGGGDATADEVERFIMNLLESSVLDSAVKALEEKAGGLFIYARLLQAQLELMAKEGKTIDFANLNTLPAGLNEMYSTNFNRTFSDKENWELCKEVVSMIVVAQEPLPEDLVQKVVGAKKFSAVKSALSLLFPVRKGDFHVMHKSVVDWLKDESRAGEKHSIGTEDLINANATLATQLWLYREWSGTDDFSYAIEGGERYAVAFGASHLSEAIALGGLDRCQGLLDLWRDATLETRKIVPREDDRKRIFKLSYSMATAAAVRLLLSQAKLQRNLKFAVELRVLVGLFGDGSEIDPNFASFLTVTIWLLGTSFNLRYTGDEQSWEDAIDAFMQRAPVTSEWHDSPGKMIMSQNLLTMPLRVNVSPLMTDLLGHGGGVTCVRIARDDKTLVSASDDRKVKIWESSTGECIMTMRGHAGTTRAVCFSNDQRRVMSGGDDSVVKIWNVATGECTKTLEGHLRTISSLCIADDDITLFSASYDTTVRIWDSVSGECLHTLKGHVDAVHCLALTRDNLRIFSGGDDDTIRAWDTTTGVCHQILKGHMGAVRCLCITGDDQQLISGSADNNVKIWGSASGACLLTLEGHAHYVNGVCLSSDDQRIVSCSADNTLKVWDSSSGECLQTIVGHSSYVNALCMSSNQRFICSASYDKSIKIWNATQGERLECLKGHAGSVNSVCRTRDMRHIISASNDSTLKIWSESGKCLSTLEGHLHNVRVVALSNDQSLLVSGSADKSLKVWGLKTAECLSTLEGHTGAIRGACFSVDDRRIYSASSDMLVKVWRRCSTSEDWECEHTLRGHTAAVNAVLATSEGLVSAGADTLIIVWRGGDIVATLRGHSSFVTCLSLCFDDEHLLSGSTDGTCKKWNMRSGDCVTTLEGFASAVRTVSMSCDKNSVISGSDDFTLKLWSLESGECTRIFKGHTGAINSIVLSQDSCQVVSASSDGTLKITETGFNGKEVRRW